MGQAEVEHRIMSEKQSPSVLDSSCSGLSGAFTSFVVCKESWMAGTSPAMTERGNFLKPAAVSRRPRADLLRKAHSPVRSCGELLRGPRGPLLELTHPIC